MTDTLRLYYGRNGDEMVRRLRDSRETQDPISSLEIRETVLEEEVIEAIVDLLQGNTVKTVQLDDCGAYLNKQPIRMARALGGVENVRLLEPTFLSHSFLDSLLMSATKLTHLRIQDRFDCRLTETLTMGLKANRSIETLDLSRSRFDSFSILAEGLRGNTFLRLLKLRSLGLNDHDMDELLDAIKHHPNLESVDLSFNRCHRSGGLSSFISNSKSIKELSIGYQNLWQHPKIDILGLARALRSNTLLKVLSLAKNKLDDSDALLLAKSLSCNKILQKLDLRENGLTDDGISVLSRAVAVAKGMRQLSVVKNPFRKRGSLALLAALETNYNLVQIDVNDNAYAREQIRFAAALNKGGRRLFDDILPLSLWPIVLERINREGWEGSSPSTTGFSFNLDDDSYQLDVLQFLLRGPALFEGALCAPRSQ